MPAEWHPHLATWMGFPRKAYPSSGVNDHEVRQSWSNVANALCDHEPVRMLCHPDDNRIAERYLSSEIERLPITLADAWLRDTGPTFVVDGNSLSAISWKFNGWGDHTSFDWKIDDQIAEQVAQISSAKLIRSNIINEGGGLAVNGEGLACLTRSVQQDPRRNPGWSELSIEVLIKQALGVEQIIWLERGLWRDYLSHGTRGHVDLVAAFAPKGCVFLHRQLNPDHPDHKLWHETNPIFKSLGLEVIAMPAPQTTRDNSTWVDYSYINHYVANGVVLCPAFGDRNDEHAKELLADIYRDRKVILIDARVLFAMGGGIHCITQQQPRLFNE